MPRFKTILMVENRQRRIDSTGGWQVLVAQPKIDKQLVSMQGIYFRDINSFGKKFTCISVIMKYIKQ